VKDFAIRGKHLNICKVFVVPIATYVLVRILSQVLERCLLPYLRIYALISLADVDGFACFDAGAWRTGNSVCAGSVCSGEAELGRDILRDFLSAVTVMRTRLKNLHRRPPITARVAKKAIKRE